MVTTYGLANVCTSIHVWWQASKNICLKYSDFNRLWTYKRVHSSSKNFHKIFTEIKARLYATGWPPSVIVSWESQIKLKDVEYKLFYGKSGDFGCQSPADLINAVWCSRNATQSNSQGIFQCDITGAYAELDIFNERSYYNLCVDITASTLSGLHFRSNMVEEELAKTSNSSL